MIVMESFDAYRIYQALKLHFEKDSYDAIKYRFKTSANPRSFWKRKDKYQFNKVAKRFQKEDDIVNYYVAHFLNGSKWVGEMVTDEDTYTQWLKRRESLSYLFEQDLYKIEDHTFDELLISVDGQYPPIIREYLEGSISIETVVVINRITGFLRKANKDITDTILWPDLYLKISKYDPFVVVDKTKMTKIILKIFNS